MHIPTVGTIFRTQITISQEKTLSFAEFSKDYNPVHISTQAAKEYGFVKPVTHGAILLSEVSRIIGMKLPGPGAFWTDIQIDFSGPVYWGEIVDIKAEVIQSSPSVRMIKLKISGLVGARPVLNGTCRVVALIPLGRRLPMPDIHKCTAVVTGGSGGLGIEVVKVLLNLGYKTISVSRKTSRALEIIKDQYEGNNHFQTIFIDIKNIKAFLQQLKSISGEGIHVIIHAASPIPVKQRLGPNIFSEINRFSDIYLNSLIQLVHFSLPFMKKKKFGRIVTIGSSFILGTPPPQMYTYVAAKEALWGLTKCLAADFGQFGITANMVSPSMMLTNMTADIPNAIKAEEVESNPLKRLVEPDEVAKTIEFLCSKKATFINGTNIPITGGML